jgi:hypothetical protein
MTQQTAVEWLAEKTAELGYVSSNILEQAKAMEKEQMIDSFCNGAEWEKYEGTFDDKFKQYYKKTYNN